MTSNGIDSSRSAPAIPTTTMGVPRGTATSAGPDDQFAHLLNDLDYRPVFIMGDHRTGTTLLYQLLAATGRFGVVTAYHIIEYDRIVSLRLDGTEERARRTLAERFATLGLTNRGLDDVTATPDTPEEYGFLIERDGFGRSRLGPRTWVRVDELCRKICFLTGDDRPVLLKNPWDSWNFLRVKAAFPDAAFVFLHRNPIRVVDSQIRALRSLYTTRNAYLELLAAWYGNLFEHPVRLRLLQFLSTSPLAFRVSLRHVRMAVSYYLDHISALPTSSVIELRYEDLCANPDTVVAGILEVLGMESHPPLDLRSKVRDRGVALLPEVERQATSITHTLEPYFRRWNYTSDA